MSKVNTKPQEDDTDLLEESSTSTHSDNDDDDSPNNKDEPLPPFLVLAISRSMGQSQSIHSLTGIILISLGSFCFSCMFLFVKFMEGKASSFTMTFYRALVEIPIALILCQRVQENPLGPTSRSIRGWLLIRGGVGGAAVLCFFYAIQRLPLPDAVTLQFTTPPFAAAFAVCLAGEPWLWIDRLGALVCLLGVMLIAHPSWLFERRTITNEKDDQQDMGAIAVGLLGAAFAGMAYTSVRKIGHGASANVMVLYYSALSLPVTVVGSKGLLGEWNVWGGGGSFTSTDWCWMLLTGVSAYSGQYLTNLGLQHETAAKGTLATCTQIVFTYVFEMAFLHERMNGWSVVGTLLIVGFMTLVALHKMNSTGVAAHEAVAADEPDQLELV
jgi:drug/metabolite transporter (DMT)-like permease